MNPFEFARLEAVKLRKELATKGIALNQGGFALVTAACKALDIALKQVKPGMALLKSADATILIERKWILVRSDAPDEIKAFLIAHELGHLRLHPTTTGSVEVSQSALTADTESNGVSVVESYGARERQELQANVFAREFLLPRWDAREAFLSHHQSVSSLAKARLLPIELVRLQMYDGVLLPHVDRPAKIFQLPNAPTPAQKPAVDSDAPVSLITAGPGTGKTTALLLRLRRLIASGISPDEIVVLTFSNKAARELIERARAGNIPGSDRVWIGTFHAFGLEFLRKFGHLHGLESRFPVLDKLASLAMLEQDVPSADLKFHDVLSNPTWLESIVDAIRRAKDEVFDARKFFSAVAAALTGNNDTDGKLKDAATIFQRYEALLAKRKAIDLTDLLCVSIRLIQSGDPAVERFLEGISHLMVDEYQDVNRASALLVQGLAKKSQTVWVVGDANQAIYAFMGASSSNLENFQRDFPGAVPISLAHNHRSSQEIVDTFVAVASRNPVGRATIKLDAERGYVGHRPSHVKTRSALEQIRALAWRIRDLETNHKTPLAEQAIITYQNAIAADIAAGLESLGVPVLFLGNIFDRGEIKDLICLFMLALDDEGTNLLRSWHAPCLALSREGADLLLAQVVSEKTSWRSVTGEGLGSADILAWSNLKRLCGLMEANTSPWEALSSILLEDGQWLRELASQSGQASANALMAIWQFAHFCRTPDGTGRWATIKNLPHRIRDRVRLNEDRSMRSVPPEAEGMNAVRVLTAHGSKGLEFDAVHFVDVKEATYAPARKPNANHHIPPAVLDASKSLEVHRNERHNLLYVAVSRPRFLSDCSHH